MIFSKLIKKIVMSIKAEILSIFSRIEQIGRRHFFTVL